MNQLVNCGHTPSEPYNIWLGAWMQTYIHVSQPVLGKWDKVIKWLKEPERKKNLKLGRFYDVYNIKKKRTNNTNVMLIIVNIEFIF